MLIALVSIAVTMFCFILAFDATWNAWINPWPLKRMIERDKRKEQARLTAEALAATNMRREMNRQRKMRCFIKRTCKPPVEAEIIDPKGSGFFCAGCNSFWHRPGDKWKNTSVENSASIYESEYLEP